MLANPQNLIGIALVVAIPAFLIAAVWFLARLAKSNDDARQVFVKLLDPASIVSLLILLGVLFLLGMAILDLDKGRVLVGMGKATFARGLITYLFAVVTIGTAVVLVLSALLGSDKERFDRGKEVLSLLLGVFGTMVGFYFASELAREDDRGSLSISSVLAAPQELAQGGTVRLTAYVRGGRPPYRFAITAEDSSADEFTELARADGWIVKDFSLPATLKAGAHKVTIAVQDMDGDRTSGETLVASGTPTVPPPTTPATAPPR